MKILIVNGVNLNMLGKRETDLYGEETLKDLENRLFSLESGADLHFFQSNSEEEIIEKIHSHKNEKYDYGIFNFGAHTHTNIAIRDAILSVKLPFYEVHISNIYAREEFRHHSFFSDIAIGSIVGFGLDGYEFALQKIIKEKNGS
ncbi:MAG: type II 3-dehydroquinate dehydratase [Flavobacteriales bacterium]|nr:type II 3-dehydroquinate dehydratase [Flavobacteriales bacterium]|tara:strand:- start:205 stop:639 length:435 start_codon:yes stop_codon:yes gene_type:complete